MGLMSMSFLIFLSVCRIDTEVSHSVRKYEFSTRETKSTIYRCSSPRSSKLSRTSGYHLSSRHIARDVPLFETFIMSAPHSVVHARSYIDEVEKKPEEAKDTKKKGVVRISHPMFGHRESIVFLAVTMSTLIPFK